MKSTKKKAAVSKIRSTTTFNAWTKNRLEYLKSVGDKPLLDLVSGITVTGLIQGVGADFVNIEPRPGDKDYITRAIPFSAILMFRPNF
jgi:hypothetical protein